MRHTLFQDFLQIDGFAVTIAFVGYVVVFVALVLLYLVFRNLPSVLNFNLFKIFNKKRSDDHTLYKSEVKITGELNAAIGMAIFLYLDELHDVESGVITIKKISKRYSPWSSKIYGLRQPPRK